MSGRSNEGVAGMKPERRTLLQALAGASALVASGHAEVLLAQSAGTITPAQFAALSATLTGYPSGDPAAAAKVLDAFAEPSQRAELGRLAELVAKTSPAGLDAAITAQGLDRIADDLVAAWYWGVASTPQGQKVVLYLDACVWKAMTFTKPMGVCGGPTGYWSQPPS